ncbi:hypothetical protein VAS14_21337 [Photobacterium angustum S14]|uniref:Uncharacterized protein n=1 Tax=Photobacterium angustum (strain S14 / CCUG 15956) TaxID=314292 RepID=Q1ZLU4_PHOAS|nr:hypothetical protein VAS14_21337 [Photobacterium angustum S14]
MYLPLFDTQNLILGKPSPIIAIILPEPRNIVPMDLFITSVDQNDETTHYTQ